MDPAWPASSALPPHLRPRLGTARARGQWPGHGLVRALGVLEPMPRGLVRRPGGTGDLFIAWFHHEVRIRVRTGLVTAPARTAMAWRPGMVQEYGRPDAAWMHSWIHLRAPFALALAEAAVIPFGTPIPVSDPAELEATLLELQGEAARKPADVTVIEALATVLLRRLARAAPRADDGLDEVRRLIESSPEALPPLAELAVVAGCSVPHLCAAFARRFGSPPRRYAVALRLARAAGLLGAGLSPSDVATRCGWGDRRQFARCFKLSYGRAPSAWRTRTRGGG